MAKKKAVIDESKCLSEAAWTVDFLADVGRVIESGDQIARTNVMDLEILFSMWHWLEVQLEQGLTHETKEKIIGVVFQLESELPVLFYAISKKLGVDAHVKTHHDFESSNILSAEWRQTWSALEGAALAGAGSVSQTRSETSVDYVRHAFYESQKQKNPRLTYKEIAAMWNKEPSRGPCEPDHMKQSVFRVRQARRT